MRTNTQLEPIQSRSRVVGLRADRHPRRLGERFDGNDIATAICNMTERGNGLGSGFSVYGCYPEHDDCYALHVMYTDPSGRDPVEARLRREFEWAHAEEVPHRYSARLSSSPEILRYFLRVDPQRVLPTGGDGDGPDIDEYVVERGMALNSAGMGAYIYSSGQNVGVFKGVGQPEQIAEYFDIAQYQGYLWTAHNRFPINTPGWWDGAHPFGLLDWTVVHNGEISSYGTNRRYLEMHGYRCTIMTDTEVIAYAADLLMRRHGLPVDMATCVLAPPFWAHIAAMPAAEQDLFRALRQAYAPLLMNGPFTVIVARQGEMIGLADRIRLRPLVAATRRTRLYVSSEEAPIRLISPVLDEVWTPAGGVPVVGRLGEPLPTAHGVRLSHMIVPPQAGEHVCEEGVP